MKKISIYCLMGIAIVSFILILLMLCPYFLIKTINIEGLDNITREEIITTLNLDKDTNLLAFNTVSAKSKLSQNNYIDSIKIKKVFPSTLEIYVIEKEIYGYVPYTNNFLYIGKDGEVIDVKTSYSKQLPIITGLEFKFFVLGEKLKVDNEEKFNIVVNFTNIFHQKDLLEDIIKIDLTDIYNIQLKIGNITVVMGDSSNLNTKINTLIEILKNIDTNQKGILYLDDTYKSPTFKYIT